MPNSPYPHSDRDLLHRIERSPGKRAGYKQLIRELGMGGGRERRMLLEQLTRMTARGALMKTDKEQWAIPAPVQKGAQREATPASRTRDNLAAGRLDLHRDGFGFVRPDANQPSGITEDIFIPPNEINGAMQGDQVLVELAPPARDGRRSGRIARILTRRNPTVVGIFHYARPRARGEFPIINGNYVTPLDERMTQPILIPDGQEVPTAQPQTPHRVLGEEARKQESARSHDSLEGLAVDVEITHFPTPGSPARGRVLEVLGDQDDFGVDVEIVIRKHHLPHVVPANVIAEAQREAELTVAAAPPAELKHRRDFRGLPIVTIDGETARDFDDAVLVQPLPNGNWQLQVHIADVAHYVREGTALDLEARLRGTSVYFPDRAIPMLPHELSTGICSLRPDEDRFVLSCLMEIDARGEVLGYEVCEGIIRSSARMTYTQVQAIIDGDPATRKQFAHLIPQFELQHELSLKLNNKRKRRGSIDFDLPEPIIEFDEFGAMLSVIRSERKWAHRLIEEFMLSANECVSTWIESQNIASLFRIHEMPDPKRVADFEEVAAGFGYSLGLGSVPVRKMQMKSDRREHRGSGKKAQGRVKTHEVVEKIIVTPQMYQRLTAQISGKPEERIVAFLMLRSLKQARYSEQNEGHFALAAPSYTHFTSPIRRYPDLIIHRIIKSLLHSGASPKGFAILSDQPNPWQTTHIHTKHHADAPAHNKRDDSPIPQTELAAIAGESSQAERRADDAARELIEWKKIKFMQDRVGEDFDAMVLSCTKYGIFVELYDLFVEGLVPIATLTDDRYTFRDTTRQICGERNGRCYRLGMKVRVLLDRVDRLQKRLQFAILLSDEEKLDQQANRAPGKRTGKPNRAPAPAKRANKSKSRSRNKKEKGKRR